MAELLSNEEIEMWESCHTELGCWYVETTQKQLQKLRDQNTAELDVQKADQNRAIQDLKKRMRTLFERSDLYMAHHILELLPQDYLKQQRCILLARIARYKEAFDIAIGELNDLPFAEKLATLAYQWKPENKKIYTQMHGALHRAGHAQAAK